MDSRPAASGTGAERVQRFAERPGFRITELRMSPAQQVAWHSHTNVRDTFYVLAGHVRVTLRDPDEQIDLVAGESWGPVRPGRLTA
jgi:quercetin dioxygenase-like cupin family protein